MKLYIDPGTGSMLFTILIGVFGAAFYSLRMLIIKLRFRLSGGKNENANTEIPLAIFADHKRYWPIFEPVCRALEKRNVPVVYMTASPDDPALTNAPSNVKAEFIGEGNKAFARLNLLSATILLSTTPSLDVFQWKRSKGVKYYVHIPHAASEIVLYRMFGIDYYDAVMLSGDYQEKDLRDLEALRELPPKELVKIGIPYMDEAAKRLETAEPIGDHPRTVLLAPSWGPSAIFSIYGEKILEVLLKTGYHVIVRPHPQSFTAEKEMMDKLMAKYPDSEQLEWNRDNDNFNALHRSDIMISDFSGVVFDFALVHNKPIIYANPDFDVSVYDAWWLNRPLWTASALPRIGEQLTDENMNNLKELIDNCLTNPKYADGIREVKAETWCNFGEGAERAAEYLVNKLEELSK